jgi:hypothetical protein
VGGQPGQRGVQLRFGVGQGGAVNDAAGGVDDGDGMAGAGPVPAGEQQRHGVLLVLVEQVTPGVEAVAGASLFGPRRGIPLTPVTGLGAPRAAGLKLAMQLAKQRGRPQAPTETPRPAWMQIARRYSTNEATHDLLGGLALLGAPGGVGAGGWVIAQQGVVSALGALVGGLVVVECAGRAARRTGHSGPWGGCRCWWRRAAGRWRCSAAPGAGRRRRQGRRAAGAAGASPSAIPGGASAAARRSRAGCRPPARWRAR